MANTVNLVTKFQPYVDEQFKVESKLSLLTNQDFDWTGAHTVKIYKIGTSTGAGSALWPVWMLPLRK